GQTNNDKFGYSVASAGDVNGDGYADVIVGAYGYQGGADAGKSYAFYGIRVKVAL
ncbi:MAG: integrin alpha, partial [Chloroflexi bacterium]|nr:integrin alpha [Chloroflexota bacterium]